MTQGLRCNLVLVTVFCKQLLLIKEAFVKTRQCMIKGCFEQPEGPQQNLCKEHNWSGSDVHPMTVSVRTVNRGRAARAKTRKKRGARFR